eukprot:scaffold56027_cov57-Phaeocystis_antarctica.AAC.3
MRTAEGLDAAPEQHPCRQHARRRCALPRRGRQHLGRVAVDTRTVGVLRGGDERAVVGGGFEDSEAPEGGARRVVHRARAGRVRVRVSTPAWRSLAPSRAWCHAALVSLTHYNVRYYYTYPLARGIAQLDGGLRRHPVVCVAAGAHHCLDGDEGPSRGQGGQRGPRAEPQRHPHVARQEPGRGQHLVCDDALHPYVVTGYSNPVTRGPESLPAPGEHFRTHLGRERGLSVGRELRHLMPPNTQRLSQGPFDKRLTFSPRAYDYEARLELHELARLPVGLFP